MQINRLPFNVLKNTVANSNKLVGFVRLGLIKDYSNKIKIVSGFNIKNCVPCNILYNKDNVNIKYHQYVELLNIGEINENNWSNITYILDTKDKNTIENMLKEDKNHIRLTSCEIIAWSNDKHKITYNCKDERYEVWRLTF